MPENDSPTDGKPTANRSKRTASYRSAVTTRPAARLDGNSAVGRRVRDLFSAIMKRLGDPVDPIIAADALAWSELKTAAEVARADLLEGKGRSSNECVRLENLTRRAAISVGLESAVGEAAPLSMADKLAGLGFAVPSDGDDETDIDDGGDDS